MVCVAMRRYVGTLASAVLAWHVVVQARGYAGVLFGAAKIASRVALAITILAPAPLQAWRLYRRVWAAREWCALNCNAISALQFIAHRGGGVRAAVSVPDADSPCRGAAPRDDVAGLAPVGEDACSGAPLRVLVLGDSSVVGMDCEICHTLPGRLCKMIHERHAEASIIVDTDAVVGLRLEGARIRLHDRLCRRALGGSRAAAHVGTGPPYDYVFLCIGGNDVIGCTPVHEVQHHLDVVLVLLRSLAVAEGIFVMIGGDIGLAPIWPIPLNYIVSARCKCVHRAFAAVCARHFVTFVDMYARTRRDVQIVPVQSLFCEDQFHPSSAAYAIQVRYIEEAMDGARPAPMTPMTPMTPIAPIAPMAPMASVAPVPAVAAVAAPCGQ